VLRQDGETFEIVPPDEALTAPPGHARELMPAIAEVMERAGVDYTGLNAIAVGVGPGSFTGLRIGVATARALAHASGLRVHAISSLGALAHGIEAELRLPLIDAKRGELFAALYEGVDERWPAFAATPEALIERVRNEALTVVAAGDGSLRFRDQLEAGGIAVGPAGSHAVRALHICRLAARVPASAPDAILPNYLREPDAKPRQP
jgi:tRNA threonylcarbamoyladenosine biosynthesis protein TsaB